MFCENLCYRAVPFIPMPMPKPVRRTKLYNKIVQLEVCRTFSGRGMGINGTAQLCSFEPRGNYSKFVPREVCGHYSTLFKQQSVIHLYIYTSLSLSIYIYIYI